MSRESGNEYDEAGDLINGFDYDLQVWVVGRVIQRCGHPYNETSPTCCNSGKYAGSLIKAVRASVARMAELGLS